MNQNAHSNVPNGSAPPVDMDWLQECTDGDLETMKKMVALHFSQTEKFLSELDTAISASAGASVRRIAHACAGSSGACGMTALAQLWKQLEKMGSDGQLDNAAAVAIAIRQELSRTREFLASQGLT